MKKLKSILVLVIMLLVSTASAKSLQQETVDWMNKNGPLYNEKNITFVESYWSQIDNNLRSNYLIKLPNKLIKKQLLKAKAAVKETMKAELCDKPLFLFFNSITYGYYYESDFSVIAVVDLFPNECN
jgi:hypothetical protein